MQAYPTVLVVEDEPILRFYESELAEGAGFLTVQACNADEALKELEGPVAIQILLTDVNMPGSMDGLELAGIVRSRWPQIRIVIASGRPDSRDPELQADSVFIPKPFTAKQLISALIDVA